MCASSPPAWPAEEPATFSRRVVLAVSGLSPQIVTETVHALATTTAAFVPTEVHLITTRQGARKALATLADEGAGWLRKLCMDHGLPAIAFDQRHIHVLQTPDGQDIDDIRTPLDNRHAADFITDAVRQHTLAPDCALHVSMAGGRKTMGFYLGYALSLFGRPQDRLSHVLVQTAYENCPDFFYPTPYSHLLTLPDGSQLDARDAQLALAEIPFVPLRHGLPQALLDGNASFNATVQAMGTRMAPPQLVMDLAARRIRAGGIVIDLPPAELAFLSVFARRAMTGQAPLPAPTKQLPDTAWAQRYLLEYRRIVGPLGDIDSTENTLKGGMDDNYFSQRKSKLERRLKARLQAASAPYCIHNGNVRPGQYHLALPAQAIRYHPL